MIQTQPILLMQIFTMPSLYGMPVCHFRKHTSIKINSQIKFLSFSVFMFTHDRLFAVPGWRVRAHVCVDNETAFVVDFN